jgi:hypothetical protein
MVDVAAVTAERDEWCEKHMTLETKRAVCCMQHEDTLARIQATLLEIEKEQYAGSNPNYRVGFREGREHTVAQIRKAMGTP